MKIESIEIKPSTPTQPSRLLLTLSMPSKEIVLTECDKTPINEANARSISDYPACACTLGNVLKAQRADIKLVQTTPKIVTTKLFYCERCWAVVLKLSDSSVVSYWISAYGKGLCY